MISHFGLSNWDTVKDGDLAALLHAVLGARYSGMM